MIFAHLSVGARKLAVAGAVKTEIQCLYNALDKRAIACDDATSFPSRRALGGMKAERNGDIAEQSSRSIRNSLKTRCRVDHDRDPRDIAEPQPGLKGNRPTERRDWYYQPDEVSLRMRWNRSGIEHPGERVYIGKVGRIAALLDGDGSCHEWVGRHHRISALAGRPTGNC